ncbi:hypothetical protein ACFYVL_40090 [Streptomyces sp. NPDC004111]
MKGTDLTWRVEFDEIVDPRCVEKSCQDPRLLDGDAFWVNGT